MRLSLDKKNVFGGSQRYRLSRALSTVLVLSLIQIVAAPILAPILSSQAQAATLSGNLNNFVQYNDWLANYATIGNHRPYDHESTNLVTDNNQELKLTTNSGGKTGFLWNEVALTGDLVVSAQYFFGSFDGGADGSYFKLMPKSNWPNGGSNGVVGSSATRGGIANSIFINFDTYQNSPDRVEDHVSALQWKGDGTYEHKDETGILLKDNSGADITQLEDGTWKDFTIKWTMSTKTLDLYSGALNSTQHLIKSWTFSGQTATEYYWGWTAETGGASNDQSIRAVNYHIAPTVSSLETDKAVIDGSSVTLSASYTSSESSPTRRWEYSTDGGSTWTSTGSSDSTYTFTASRSLTQRKYRFYVESTAVGVTYSKSTTPITLTVLPPTLNSETDTALSLNASNQYAKIDGTILPTASGSAFTLEAWIYPTDAGTNDVIFSQGTGSQRFYVKRASGNLIYFRDGFNTTTSEITCGAVPANSWTHIAITWNGSNETNCYINANKVRTSTSALSSIKTLNEPSFIGQYSADPTVPASTAFAGQIDELKIWGSVRDQSQILSSSNSRVDTSDANLIAYYDFNEGSTTNIYNRKVNSVSASDFVIQNSATFASDSITTSSISQAYTVQRFFRSYITANNGWKVPSGVSRVSALVVGGGGGGGDSTANATGGGGGAGGFFQNGNVSISGVLAIGVGTGGSGSSLTTQGIDGGTSYLGTLKVGGGGGGNGYNYAGGSRAKAGVGGSDFVSGGSGGGGRPTGSGVGNENLGGLAGSFASSGISFLGNTYVGFQGAAGSAYSDGASGGWGGTISQANRTSSFSGSSVIYSKISTYVTWESSGNEKTPGSGGSPNYGYGTDPTVGGGDGAAGIIVLRWITASAPIYTPPVAVDTTTAGITKTFQMSGTANSPLIRNYTWQFSNDTGTSWSTLQASTSDSYTTTTLETTTSGSRYSYRVIVTDSDTAGLSISDSSTFTLVINPRITITGSSVSLTQKYGETQTVTYTIANGTGTRTTVASPNNQTGITWSSISGSSATLAIGSNVGFGTYYETLTVTDSVTATTTQMITIAISKADTITVTLNSPSALNYSGSTASFTPSVTFGGLQSTDAATASSVTITQTRAGNTCAMGGTCSIGDRGPGGGIVFITPSTASGNGKYFEAAPDAWYGTNDLSSVGKFCTAASSRDNTNEGATQYGIGWGETNTAIFMANCTGGAVKLATDYRGGGFSDWFVPSANELDEMRANYSTVDLIKVSGYWGYWSSSENSASVMKSLDNSGSWVMGAVNKSDSTHNMIRPVRMFTPCNEVDSCTAFASTTMPTNAGTYRLTPSALSLSSGDLANYQGVTYASGLLTINKVSQTPITIGQYDAYPGVSTYPLNVYGGSGTGVMRRALTSAGTASCELTNIMFLTATSPGICDVRVTKAADFNYLAAEATATIYWIQFQTNYSNGAAGGATGITLTGETAIEKRTYETFTVLSFANGSGAPVTSVAMNSIMRIIGTGFNPNDQTTEVIIGFTNIPKSSLTFDITDPLANFVQFQVPDELDLGANDVAMRSAKGWAEAPETLNISGILMAAM